MQTRYRLGLAAVVLVLGAALAAAAATGPHPSPSGALQRVATLRALNLLQPHFAPGRTAPVRARLNAVASDPGVIAGTLYGLDADAVASAQVIAWTETPPDSLTDPAVTGRGVAVVMPDGQYRIEALVAGKYHVMATAKGYVPQEYEVGVMVSAGEVTSGIDFKLQREVTGTGAISGTVRASLDGRPLAGAAVHAYLPENPFVYAIVTSERDGSYRLTGLSAGAYVVEAWFNGFAPEFYPEAVAVEQAVAVQVTDGGAAEGVDFTLASGGTISGYVRHADGTPVMGAWVQVSRDKMADSLAVGDPGGWMPDYTGWAVTDDQGFYSVGGLMPGSWRVMAQAASRWFYAYEWYPGTQDYNQSTAVAVTEGAEVGKIDFTLALPSQDSAISGRVTDLEGHPVGGAFVSVQNAAAVGRGRGEVAQTPMVWAYATTDEDGRYVVGELPASEYVVAAAAQSGWQYIQAWYGGANRIEEAAAVALVEGQRAENVDVVLPVRAGTGTLSGIVRDTQGQPLAWAYVDVTLANGDADGSNRLYAWAQTDSAGAYRVDRLPAGDYVVHASYNTGDRFGQAWFDGAGAPERAVAVSLADGGGRDNIDFMLNVRPLYGTVSGAVTDAGSGVPLYRAYVELSAVARDATTAVPFRYSVSYALTDEKGRYELSWVPEGTYTLSVYADGGGIGPAVPGSIDANDAFEVAGGQLISRDVAIAVRQDGNGVIAGTVTSQGGGGPVYTMTQSDGVDGGLAAPAQIVGVDGRRPFYYAGVDVAMVVAYPVSGGAEAAQLPYLTVTGVDGTYALRGLAPGDYVVMSFAPGCIGVYYGGGYTPEKAQVVTVDGITKTEGIDFALAPIYYWRVNEGDALAPTARAEDKSGAGASNATNAVFGRVTDASGAPVAGAIVYLLDESEQPAAFGQTGADGSFEVSGMVPGGYRLYASKLGVGAAYNGNRRSFAEAEPLSVNGGYVEVNLVLAGHGSTAVTDEEGQTVPRLSSLAPCYPNPFNPSTMIRFSVARDGLARLRVFNATGQQVGVVFDGVAQAGQTYSVVFDASQLAGGTYLCSLETADQRLTRAMTLLK
jgi:protocatechuate 3,4-dioxygenase beta subunit